MSAADEIRIEPWGPDDLPFLKRTMHLGGPESDEKLAERQVKHQELAGSGEGRMCQDRRRDGPQHRSVGYWDNEWEGLHLRDRLARRARSTGTRGRFDADITRAGPSKG